MYVTSFKSNRQVAVRNLGNNPDEGEIMRAVNDLSTDNREVCLCDGKNPDVKIEIGNILATNP